MTTGMMTALAVAVVSTILSIVGSLVVWAIRDVKLAITKNTLEVNELKVAVAKLQIMVASGGKRIEKLEADNKDQWRYINKQQQSKGQA